MIRCQYTLENGRYTSLHVSGHAESGDYGKDLIYAAVSSIMFGFMNAVDESKEKAEIRQSENDIELIAHSDSEVLQHYFELVLIQLKTIEASYGEFIQTERKQNT